MLKSFKIIVRNYEKKAGGSFTKITCGGKYLPLITAEEDVNYQVKFTKASKIQEPTVAGIYEVAYEDNGLWIDSRQADKAVVRVNAVKCLFNKALAPVEKDARLK